MVSGCPEIYLNGIYTLSSGENWTSIYEKVDESFLFRIVHRIQRRKNFIRTNGWTLVTDHGYRTQYRYFSNDADCPGLTTSWYPVTESKIAIGFANSFCTKIFAFFKPIFYTKNFTFFTPKILFFLTPKILLFVHNFLHHFFYTKFLNLEKIFWCTKVNNWPL